MRFNEKPQAQIKAGDRNAALQLFEEALQTARTIQEDHPDRTKSQKIIALSHIAESQYEAGYSAGLQKTFGEAQEIATTISDAWTRAVALYVVLAPAQVKTGEVTSAKKSLAAAKEAALLSEKESPLMGLHTLSQIVDTEVGMGDTDAARQTVALIYDVVSAMLAPVKKFEALCIVVKSQVATNDIAAAKQTIIKTQRAAAAIAQTQDERPAISIGRIDGNHSVAAAIRDLMEIAELQVYVGDITAAKQTASALTDPRDRSDAFLKIVTAQADWGDIMDAKQTLEVIADDYDKSLALCQIAEAQAKQGDIIGAKQTAYLITAPYDRCASLRAIAAVQKDAGDLSEATQTYVAAQNSVFAITSDLDWTKAMILREIGEAQLEAGDKRGAWQTLLAAQQIAVNLPTTDVFNARYKPSALKSIAAAQAKAGNSEAAMRAVDVITNPQSKSDALKDIAVAQAQIGDVAAAIQTVALTGNADAECRYKAEALTAIALVQSETGDQTGAKQTFSEARQAAVNADSSQDMILRNLAEAQVKAGETSGALQTVEALSEYISKSIVLRKIAEAQGPTGDFNGARETINKIGDANVNAEALAQLAAVLWKAATNQTV